MGRGGSVDGGLGVERPPDAGAGGGGTNRPLSSVRLAAGLAAVLGAWVAGAEEASAHAGRAPPAVVGERAADAGGASGGAVGERKAVAVAAVAIPAVRAAGELGGAAAPGTPAAQVPRVARDTLLWVIPQLRDPDAWLLGPRPPPAPVVRLGLAAIPAGRLPGAPVFAPRPLFGAAGPVLPALDWSDDPLFRLGAWGRTIGFGDVPRPRAPGRAPAGPAADRLVNDYADLGFAVRGSGDLGGEWVRFRPCDETVQATCEVPAWPRILSDIRFAATADGTVAGRARVDVDYDQTREYAGANRVNIHYQGRPGEFLQSLDVGDIGFDLPASRFLREGVPAGNFGFRAVANAGPLDMQAVWAQQNGEVTSRRFQLESAGRSYSRSDTLALDDADYAAGQFFFLFDPVAFAEYPHVDVLSLPSSSGRIANAPAAGHPVQLYRSAIDLYAQQQVEGAIQAEAVAGLGADTVRESAWFRYLQPGQDYVVHPSGLWVALRSPLGPSEMLAVSYVTAAGDTVGAYNPERVYRAGGLPRLRLLRASQALHQPGRPTWRTEMHQVYRVSSSSDVAPGSLDLVISAGSQSAGRTFARRPNGDDVTYLRLLGMDEDAPADRLDESQVYRPARDSFDDLPPVRGTYVVFPSLEPFADPGPVASLSMGADEARAMLGANRNTRIYGALDPFERRNGGVFRLSFAYEVRGAGLVSSFDLEAVGIRPGTETVTLGDQVLERGADYSIDYDLGQLELTDPGGLLAANPARQLEVSWEQRSFFQVAPTSVLGASAKYGLGAYGALSAFGLYQTEGELVRRPQLGVEARSVGLGGAVGSVDLDAPQIARVLAAVGGLREGERASVRLSGEALVSLPNPNTQGAAYLDDYDGTEARRLSVRSHDWRLGSRPAFRDGAEHVLPADLSEANVAALSWQHQWIVEDAAGDSLGVFGGFHPATDIDHQIRITGSAARDQGLHVRFDPGRGDRDGPQAWSAITTVLSPAGADLTKSDLIEFYVRDGEHLNLVLDVGVVSEDAFFVDAGGMLGGVKTGTGVPWGEGRLDQEADPRRGEVWGDLADARGVWDEQCLQERGRVYRLGDADANCTRGNGRPDSEDLDEDGVLDTTERYRRFVIPLDGSSRFLARDRGETGTRFRLYRIPLRDPAALDVGGPVGEAELRAVRHVRLAVTGARRDSFVLARFGIVGSTWIKRAQSGVLAGLGGDRASARGRVEVGPVSALTAGDAYVSPPGVVEQLDDPTATFGGQGVEFNERSLSVAFEDLQPGDRAEVYNRFPQRPRDFLPYREARLWVVAPRGDGFGLSSPSWFFLKVGTDAENFYLYRTRLEPSAAQGRVREEDWLPEVVVDFDEWLDLRRVAEDRLVRDPRAAGADPLVVWSPDSAYAVVMRDRGRAPNLAAVREMSVGVLNETGRPISGEVWVDELRLHGGLREAGLASAFDAVLEGGGFLQSRASLRTQGGFFRQLREAPSFRDERGLDLRASLQLGRLVPDAWGLEAPLTVTYERDRQAPVFLERSDVRADRLEGLRRPGFGRVRADVSIRRNANPSDGFWRAVADGLDLRAGVVRSSFRTATAESDSEGVDGFLGYSATPGRRDFPLFPGRAGDFLKAVLPRFLEDRIAGARLRWTPELLSFEGELARQDVGTRRFRHVIRTPEDSLATVVAAPRKTFVGTARIALRPFESFSAEADLTSGRDLLDPAQLVAGEEARELLADERARLASIDFGWEVERRLRTRLAFLPRLSNWARTSVQATTLYLSERNSDLIGRPGGPNAPLRLLRNAGGRRDLSAALSIEPARLAAERAEAGSAARRVLGAVAPLSITYANGYSSRFNRDAVDPGAAYELGWGRREDFLRIGPDSASVFSHRRRLSLRGGTALIGSLSVGLGYDRSLHETLDARSDRDVARRVWPDVEVVAADLPRPGFLAAFLRRASASGGYRRETRTRTFGAGSLQDRFREDREVPVTLTLRFAGGLSVAYRGRSNRGESADPTGDTRRRSSTHSVAASAPLRSPLRMFRAQGAPMTLTLNLGYADETECRVASPGGPCVPFVDQLDRTASFSVDSSVRDFQLGVRLRFIDRRSFVGQRAGTTRFRLDVHGRFALTPAMLRSRT